MGWLPTREELPLWFASQLVRKLCVARSRFLRTFRAHNNLPDAPLADRRVSHCQLWWCSRWGSFHISNFFSSHLPALMVDWAHLSFVQSSFRPGGTFDNSPVFPTPGGRSGVRSPEGTTEWRIDLAGNAFSIRPCGTHSVFHHDPALKRRAILDCPSGTKNGFAPVQETEMRPVDFTSPPFR